MVPGHSAGTNSARAGALRLNQLRANCAAEYERCAKGSSAGGQGDSKTEPLVVATIKAADIRVGLYEMLEAARYPERDTGVFLSRLLFALYADDAGIWERELFHQYVEERTSEDGSDVGARIANFFQVVNKPEGTRQITQDEMVQRFPYVNGGIFADPIEIAAFNKDMRDRLLEACAFNWASISPAIFGSLFQAVKDPQARRELGEHYTTETNILKTINPLFMDGLQARYEKNQHSIPGLKKLRRALGRCASWTPPAGAEISLSSPIGRCVPWI